MSELKQFCYIASQRVMIGLAQELQVYPHHHYYPTGNNAARVLSLRLVGINPHYLKKIQTMGDTLTMWAGLDDRQRVRVGWDGRSIIIEIPKPARYWQQITIEQLERRRYLRRGIIATLGVGIQDEPRRINFQEAAIAHVFIAGQTRSGKTNTERLIAWNLARNASPELVKLLIFDVTKKGFNWSDFNQVAHLAHPVITDCQEADQVLTWLALEIDRRAEQRRQTPRIIAFVDELKALISDSRVAADLLARIAAVGAEFGLHLVLATQYPQVQLLGKSELKRNVTTRLCGKVDDAQATVNALGVPDSGAESLQGYGDFLLQDFTGLARLTVAKLEARDMALLPRAEPARLDLPGIETVNNSPRPRNEPDPLEPEQVGLALFEPMSINKLGRRLGVGNTKATRITEFANRIRTWALDQGFNCLELNQSASHPSQMVICLPHSDLQ